MYLIGSYDMTTSDLIWLLQLYSLDFLVRCLALLALYIVFSPLFYMFYYFRTFLSDVLFWLLFRCSLLVVLLLIWLFPRLVGLRVPIWSLSFFITLLYITLWLWSVWTYVTSSSLVACNFHNILSICHLAVIFLPLSQSCSLSQGLATLAQEYIYFIFIFSQI